MQKRELTEIVLSILTAEMRGDHSAAELPDDETVVDLIKSAKNKLRNEPSLLRLSGQIVVVGDIHGNIDDLLRIFERNGYPPKRTYLFLGDYVDRGSHSVEVLLLLYALKVLYPAHLYMIRGNHECESVTSVYGFKRECFRRIGVKAYYKFIKSFSYLPFAAVINDSVFCVHGGISPVLGTLEDIEEIEKPSIAADNEIANDMVWSDPNPKVNGFKTSDRGSGYFFDNEKLDEFLENNNLSLLIRSHESCAKGYARPLDKCLTVFSNCDYCGMGNKAAVAIVHEDSDVTLEKFQPLNDDDLEKRRIILPEWILRSLHKRSMLINPITTLKFEPVSLTPIDIFV